jgi:hypothetical protein
LSLLPARWAESESRLGLKAAGAGPNEKNLQASKKKA